MNTNILQQALAYIQDKIGDFQPKLALILGSGCGPLVDPLTKTISIPYQDIPISLELVVLIV